MCPESDGANIFSWLRQVASKRSQMRLRRHSSDQVPDNEMRPGNSIVRVNTKELILRASGLIEENIKHEEFKDSA
jgi:hypothetical protein